MLFQPASYRHHCGHSGTLGHAPLSPPVGAGIISWQTEEVARFGIIVPIQRPKSTPVVTDHIWQPVHRCAWTFVHQEIVPATPPKTTNCHFYISVCVPVKQTGYDMSGPYIDLSIHLCVHVRLWGFQPSSVRSASWDVRAASRWWMRPPGALSPHQPSTPFTALYASTEETTGCHGEHTVLMPLLWAFKYTEYKTHCYKL